MNLVFLQKFWGYSYPHAPTVHPPLASKIFTAGGPPGGQPPYRTAQLFAVETRPPHHHQTPEYNCQKRSNSHKIVSGRHNNTTFDYVVPPTLKMLCVLILSYVKLL